MRGLFLVAVICFISFSRLLGQGIDSFSVMPPKKDSGWVIHPGQPVTQQAMYHNPFYAAGKEPVILGADLKKKTNKDVLFYVMLGLLFLFALLREAFPKYFTDLFRLFFRTTLKQRQIRDQLMQTPLPSLLLNGFFVITASLYVDFMLLYYQLIKPDEFWLYFFYACIGISSIYFVKFLGLKILGYIFNLRIAADSYIFIVFIINKVIGVALLPFLIMLAFMEGTGYELAKVLSWCLIAILLLYRVILTYSAVRSQVKFNPFHFFIYLCAFEIAPLLLIYKLLLVYFK